MKTRPIPVAALPDSNDALHLRTELARARAEHDAYRMECGRLDVLFADLRAVAARRALEPRKQASKQKPARAATAVSFVAHRTDWHYGAVQEPSEIEHFNAFSPEICSRRAAALAAKEIASVELARKSFRVDEVVILRTGDFISGDIHQELQVTNACPAPVQAVRAAELFAAHVAEYAVHFPVVRVEDVISDNHSRLTKKPQAKEAGLNSYNYIVGVYAKELLSRHANVKYTIYPKIMDVVRVQNRRYLITHGNTIRQWMGIPFYGIQREIGREAEARMNLPDDRHFDRMILGHFHVPGLLGRVIIGGSLSGTDAYDHQDGRHSPPAQTSWLVHPQHGEFNFTAWNLQGA